MKEEIQSKMAALYALAANFGKDMPESLLDMWLDLLAPYSAAQVEAGVRQVIAEYEFKTLPPFAVLRKAIDTACGIIPQEEARDVAAVAEWGKLIDSVRGLGRYNAPRFCPTTAYVLRIMGGWGVACAWEEDELHWRRREFVEAWKLAYGREEVMELGARGVYGLQAGKEHERGPVPVGGILAAALPEIMEGAQ